MPTPHTSESSAVSGAGVAQRTPEPQIRKLARCWVARTTPASLLLCLLGGRSLSLAQPTVNPLQAWHVVRAQKKCDFIYSFGPS